jgi:hypothetical protein
LQAGGEVAPLRRRRRAERTAQRRSCEAPREVSRAVVEAEEIEVAAEIV